MIDSPANAWNLSALAILSFIEPMLLQPSKVLPFGEQWLYELKFDGYRGLAIKNQTSRRLYSRNGKIFIPIVQAMQNLRVKANSMCDASGRALY